MGREKLVPVRLPEKYFEGLDTLIERGIYPNRTEGIRDSVKKLLDREYWGRQKGS